MTQKILKIQTAKSQSIHLWVGPLFALDFGYCDLEFSPAAEVLL